MHKPLFPTASLAAFLTAFFAATGAPGTEPAATPESAALFKQGVAHLQHQRYVEAYGKLKEAYALTPRWTVLGNIGLAAEQLERDGEAIDVMEEYLRRGRAEIAPAEARAVRTAIERLRNGSAAVTLDAPGAFWIVDTRFHASGAVVNEYGPFEGKAKLHVRPGQHEFVLDRASIVAAKWTVRLAASDTAAHAFEPEPVAGADVETVPPETRAEPQAGDAPAEPRSRTASYVLWGVGAGASIAAAIIVVHANNLQNDADGEYAQVCASAARDEAYCSSSTGSDQQAARWRTTALVTGVGALGALVAGTVLYFVADDGPEGTAAHEAALQPWISPAGIGLTGSF